MSQKLTLTDLARQDARFTQARHLRIRDVLADVVQDSADLQGAHLNLRCGRSEWRGTPGRLDGEGTSSGPSPFHGWSESTLIYGLGLDLGETDVRATTSARLLAEVSEWPAGLVYTFRRSAEGVPHVSRRLNLSNFIDRLECDFLACLAAADLSVVRAHRLVAGGRMDVLRASPWWV
ncbi:hypothetical protein [Deinococcus hopiensis]|uniref:hypothetical protein n=1 Tax=Deinococcus hopiensis TaxID=309885 RepID=UPI0009FD4E62|nr:hypothetical protein [Deinococcus hopiensis]